MSVQIDWFFENSSHNEREQRIGEGELAWMPGYGDSSGKEICVWVADGAAKLVRATVQAEKDEEGNLELSVDGMEELEDLPVGEPRIHQVSNSQGEKGMVQIRNLGACAEYPEMHPAWN